MRTQSPDRNAHDFEPVAVLEVDHLTRLARNNIYDSIQEDSVRKVQA
jgi:hypothetical protein